MGQLPTVDTAKLATLRYVNGLSYQAIADAVGLSNNTVYERLQKFEQTFGNLEVVDAFRVKRADILSGLQAKLVARIGECLEPENRQKVSAYQATGMFALLYDKERLETGKSTSNISALTRIIEVSQESGDDALRKQSVEVSSAKITKPNDDNSL